MPTVAICFAHTYMQPKNTLRSLSYQRKFLNLLDDWSLSLQCEHQTRWILEKIFSLKCFSSENIFSMKTFEQPTSSQITQQFPPQIVPLHSAPGRRATVSSNARRNLPAAPRSSCRRATHHSQTSTTRARAARSPAPWAGPRGSLPDRRRATRAPMSAIITRRRTGSVANKRRRSRTRGASRTKNVRRREVALIDPSQTRACTSEYRSIFFGTATVVRNDVTG